MRGFLMALALIVGASAVTSVAMSAAAPDDGALCPNMTGEQSRLCFIDKLDLPDDAGWSAIGTVLLERHRLEMSAKLGLGDTAGWARILKEQLYRDNLMQILHTNKLARKEFEFLLRYYFRGYDI